MLTPRFLLGTPGKPSYPFFLPFQGLDSLLISWHRIQFRTREILFARLIFVYFGWHRLALAIQNDSLTPGENDNHRDNCSLYSTYW